MATPGFKLLRTKLDEATADDDWVGTNALPAGFTVALDGGLADADAEDGFDGIEVIVLGCTSARVPVNRGSNDCTVTLVRVTPRSIASLGGTAGDADMLSNVEETASVQLQDTVYFPFIGGRYTVRITANTSISGVDRLQIWTRRAKRP